MVQPHPHTRLEMAGRRLLLTSHCVCDCSLFWVRFCWPCHGGIRDVQRSNTKQHCTVSSVWSCDESSAPALSTRHTNISPFFSGSTRLLHIPAFESNFASLLQVETCRSAACFIWQLQTLRVSRYSEVDWHTDILADWRQSPLSAKPVSHVRVACKLCKRQLLVLCLRIQTDELNAQFSQRVKESETDWDLSFAARPSFHGSVIAESSRDIRGSWQQ